MLLACEAQILPNDSPQANEGAEAGRPPGLPDDGRGSLRQSGHVHRRPHEAGIPGSALLITGICREAADLEQTGLGPVWVRL